MDFEHFLSVEGSGGKLNGVIRRSSPTKGEPQADIPADALSVQPTASVPGVQVQGLLVQLAALSS